MGLNVPSRIPKMVFCRYGLMLSGLGGNVYTMMELFGISIVMLLSLERTHITKECIDFYIFFPLYFHLLQFSICFIF